MLSELSGLWGREEERAWVNVCVRPGWTWEAEGVAGAVYVACRMEGHFERMFGGGAIVGSFFCLSACLVVVVY